MPDDALTVLKMRVFANKFIDSLRDGCFVDEAELQNLLEILAELAHALQDQDKIDKDLAQDLLGQLVVTTNMLESSKTLRPQVTERIYDIREDITELILRCLQSRPNVPEP